jgi:pyruvate dehydrogenase E2 component (dihydrolipoamide acetyltransferase)
MATQFTLPELGENIEEAQVISVMVAAGDSVDSEQAVIEVETDKAVMEVPIPQAGKVTQVMVGEGDTIKVGEPILSYDAGGGGAADAPAKEEAPAEPAPAAEPASAGDSPEPAAPAKPQAAAPPEPKIEESSDPAPQNIADGRLPVFASPTVRRLAREVGVDITNVEGTGPGGRISEEDVKKHARRGGSSAGAPAAGGAITAPPLPDFSALGSIERKSMSMIAKKTAQQMALCWATIPHVTLNETVDVTDLEAFRQANKKYVERAGGKLTVTAILVKLVTEGLKRYPILNCSFDQRAQELVYKNFYNIGVAADTPRGLVVPVIKNADTKSLADISVALGDMAAKARESKLAIEDMQGGTFTITNLGGIGVGHFSPIVNYPEVAILGIGTSRSTVTRIDGDLKDRLMMPVSLSFDHRVVNGADGARFLAWIKNAIEQPLGALLG